VAEQAADIRRLTSLYGEIGLAGAAPVAAFPCPDAAGRARWGVSLAGANRASSLTPARSLQASLPLPRRARMATRKLRGGSGLGVDQAGDPRTLPRYLASLARGVERGPGTSRCTEAAPARRAQSRGVRGQSPAGCGTRAGRGTGARCPAKRRARTRDRRVLLSGTALFGAYPTTNRRGFPNVRNLAGSIFEWANSGFPLVRDGESASVVHPFDERWGTLLEPELRAEPFGHRSPSKQGPR
jgi:hypothetical protein